ncbi:MAG TPA: hypothetical protein DIW51_11475 [Rhodospirillaceae bacterium]|nr:hypothetical protein [Rhodospirillaceae bacterium]HCS70572.1 hypothetical protein [Rhodospirillaceae bacterium]|tara:strand:- start:22666 stop:22932 length:267 start_codon:yes stop_codon:yes gene_type:complete
MSPAAAWAVIVIGFVLPLIHVALSKAISPAKPAEDGAACPFSPRMGWLVIVLFLGPVGWLMFMASRRKRRAMAAARAAAAPEPQEPMT